MGELKRQVEAYSKRCAQASAASEFVVFQQFVAYIEIAIWLCRCGPVLNHEFLMPD